MGPLTGKASRRYWQAAAVLVALAPACLIGWRIWSGRRADQLWNEAEAAIRASQWERAEEALARRAWYKSEDSRALRLWISVALRRGDQAKAAALSASYPAAAPDAERVAMNRGRLLMELFRLREAEAVFAECARRNPRLFEARRQLVIIAAIQRRAAEGEAVLWDLLDRGMEPLFALALLAQSRPTVPDGAMGPTGDEGKILEGCLRADSEDPHVRPALSYYYRHRGRVADARRMLDPWVRDHPADTEAAHERLACLLDDGDLQSARRRFEIPVEADRRSATYWTLRGEWLKRQGRMEEAIGSFREAVRLAPRDPDPRYRLGVALRAAGRRDESAEALAWAESAYELKALVSRFSEQTLDPALLSKAGKLCLRMGRLREARGWFSEALRLDPSNPEAREALALSQPPGADDRKPTR